MWRGTWPTHPSSWAASWGGTARTRSSTEATRSIRVTAPLFCRAASGRPTGAVLAACHFRAFDPLDFIAEVVSHIPDANEKVTISYGWYSNRTRGFRRANGLPMRGVAKAKPEGDAAADSDRASLEVRKRWAQLIQKIYEVDPLACPRCGAAMRVIAVIDDEEVVHGILSHLDLLPKDGARSPPEAATPPPEEDGHGARELVYEAFYDDMPFGESE